MTDLPQSLVDGIEAIKAEAYQRGWDDCATAIFDAAAEKAGSAPAQRKPKPLKPVVATEPPAPSPDDLVTAVEAGRQAAQAAISRTEYPYPRGSTLAKAWDDGWLLGETDFMSGEVGA